jgi:hypothetical protein
MAAGPGAILLHGTVCLSRSCINLTRLCFVATPLGGLKRIEKYENKYLVPKMQETDLPELNCWARAETESNSQDGRLGSRWVGYVTVAKAFR